MPTARAEQDEQNFEQSAQIPQQRGCGLIVSGASVRLFGCASPQQAEQQRRERHPCAEAQRLAGEIRFHHFRRQTIRHDQLLRKLNSDSTPAAITEKKRERGKLQMNAENYPHKSEENQRPVRPMNVKEISSLRIATRSARSGSFAPR